MSPAREVRLRSAVVRIWKDQRKQAAMSEFTAGDKNTNTKPKLLTIDCFNNFGNRTNNALGWKFERRHKYILFVVYAGEASNII